MHVVDERRQLPVGEALGEAGEDLKSVAFGTADVTIARTNAIERTAPVFCSSIRAPAAMPRRWAGTVPIIAAVFGLLNMPEPTPTIGIHSLLSQ